MPTDGTVTSANATPPGARHGLRRDAIGLREVLFQSITDMAPGAAIAASILAGAAFAGGSLPLAVVFALGRVPVLRLVHRRARE